MTDDNTDASVSKAGDSSSVMTLENRNEHMEGPMAELRDHELREAVADDRRSPGEAEADLPRVSTETRDRIRSALSKLRASKCTCLPHPSGHDMFDLECERTVAEVEYDDALSAAGVQL